MLEFARSSSYEPATNPRSSSVTPSSWLQLLPSLALNRVTFVGEPDPALRDLFARVAHDVLTVPRTSDVPPSGCDLAIVTRSARRDSRVGPSGVAVYWEPGAYGAEIRPSLALSAAHEATRPAGGGNVMSIPFVARGRDRRIRRLAHLLTARLTGRRIAAVPRSQVTYAPERATAHDRSGGLLQLPEDEDMSRLPAYIRRAARKAGADLDDHAWLVAPHGDYWSQKVVFFAVPEGGAGPTTAVKVSRHPAFSDRLLNEWTALSALAGAGWGSEGEVPRPFFSAVHNGFAVVAESTLHGRRFEEASSLRPECPLLGTAVDRLVALGTDPGLVDRVPGAEAAGALGELVTVAASRLRLPGATTDRLRGGVETIASFDSFPTVLQHGDAGPWNLVVGDHGTIGFLDWENYERRGVPLWDLFYLVQSTAALSTRSRARRYGPATFARDMSPSSPWRALLDAAVARVHRAIELPGGCRDVLFDLCWAHQALKESTRVAHGGLYRSILVATTGERPSH